MLAFMDHTLGSDSHHSGSKGWSPRISYREELLVRNASSQAHPRPAGSEAQRSVLEQSPPSTTW